MDGFEHCRVEREGHRLTVTIDRPAALNALHPPAHAELARAFDLFSGDPNLRVAVITGVGARAFCAGTDLKHRSVTGLDDHPPSGFAGITRRFDLDKPVVAVVNGLALGGGLEIVAACDLAIAVDDAVFGLPEVRVGLAALGGGALHRLARQLPLKFAMELALTGRRFTAGEALQMGLVNRVVPREALAAATRELVGELLAGAPLAVQASKQAMSRGLAAPDLRSAIEANYPAARRMLDSEDAVEGQRAFVEKRPPIWRGR